ncbi:MAG: S9 family peptidase [Steroidobacteraceae bacterium]|nr:S9 family peptidase [Nevskiaceae bacterium]MCP5339395.1 S9 family peptidase [Nevskiaceae bacterium]MCP5466577.1 S9 family peptidase [Nevskiaceae bacterium]MCP5471325.1 S9 family peptidase [Nevskiaceae bacterium]
MSRSPRPPAAPAGRPAAAPQAAQRPHPVVSPHGTRIDPWYWLRDDDREDPEILAHLRAENAWREQALAHLAGLETTLYDEIVGRIKQDDASVPVRHNGWWYYTRYETGREYPIYARKRATPGESLSPATHAAIAAPEQLLIDANLRAQGKDFYEVASLEVSPDNRLLAFTEDHVGRREYTLRILELDTGLLRADTIHNVEPDLAWSDDNRSLLYIEKDPQTLLGKRVRRHVLDTPPGDDLLVYEQEDEAFYLGVERSKSDRHIYIVSQSTVSSEYLWADAADPALQFRMALPRERDHEYQLEHLGERFVIRTNWQASNFRIMEAPIASIGDRSTWRDVIPHRADAFIAGFDVFDRFLAVSERSGALRKLRIHAWDGSLDRLIDTDESAYTMALGASEETDTDLLRFVYSSLTTPATTWDYDMRSGQRTLLKREPVLGDFDSARYRTELLWAPARDGARIPVSLLWHRDTPQDGSAPLYQYGYGAYGASQDPVFRSSLLSLVDRGFVYAIAHVRGGQELGRAWYDAGRLLHKQHSFDDFVDVTRFLVRERRVAADRVFAMGGSAGGLLIGTIANQAPHDYRALIAHVPFVDIVTTMLDESIPLTTNEYDEWGNPATSRAAYDGMLAYSPYDNVVAQDYPAMLVTTGLWDSQVQYWEPVKWVAKLRATRTNSAALLMRINLEAGHGGKSGRFERYREVAEEFAFVLDQAGLVPATSQVGDKPPM